MKKQALIDYFGTPSDLARAAGVTRQAVHNWPEDVPYRRVVQLARKYPDMVDRCPHCGRFDAL